MGSRNFGLKSRDMSVAGRFALQQEMMSYSSIATMAERWNRCVQYLRDEHSIRRMEHISIENLLAYGSYLAQLVEDGSLALATAHNYLSTANRVLEIARKDRAVWVSPTHDCGLSQRSGIATSDMSVPEGLHQRWLATVDSRIGALLTLQRQFGLRFEESAKLDARRAFGKARTSPWLIITDGTKGGLERKIPILTSAQMLALKSAADIQGKDRSLIPGEMSYRSFRQHCYRVAVQFGVRFHRERHTYAQRRYATLIGAESPVVSGIKHGQAHWSWLAERLGLSLNEAKAQDLKARQQIAEELGHQRIGITNAYLG